MRHRLFDLLPDFPENVDPDDPAHGGHPVISSLTSNGGIWKGIQVGWVLADPRMLLVIGPGTDPGEGRRFLDNIAQHREKLITELEAKNGN